MAEMLLVAILIVCWIVHRLYVFGHWTRRGIPGPKANILFGNCWESSRRGFLTALSDHRRKYGHIFGIYSGFQPLLIVSDVEFAKKVQRDHFNDFIDRGEPTGKQGLSNSVVSQTGETWKRSRSIISAAFTTSKLRSIASAMESSINEFIERVKKSEMSNKEFNLSEAYRHLTADVITRVAMGVDYKVQKNEGNRIVPWMDQLVSVKENLIVVLMMSFPVLRYFSVGIMSAVRACMNKTDKFRDAAAFLMADCRAVIQERRENLSLPRCDLLQILLEAQELNTIDVANLEARECEQPVNGTQQNGVESKKAASFQSWWRSPEALKRLIYRCKSDSFFRRCPARGSPGPQGGKKSLSEEEVLENAFFILIAGYETTATTLATASHAIMHDPRVQARLREELASVDFETNDLFDQVDKLPYLDSVVKECLRLYCPIFMTTRECRRDIVIEGVQLRKGDILGIWNSAICVDDRYWKDPLVFRPERFTDDEIVPAAYQPFGGGPRNCLGMRFALMEIKLTLAKLLSQFELRAGPATPETLALETTLILRRPAHSITCNAVSVKA